MPKRRTTRRKERSQRGGILPLAALIPAAVAAGKAAALGAASGTVGYGVKKGLEAATRRRRPRRAATVAERRSTPTTLDIRLCPSLSLKQLTMKRLRRTTKRERRQSGRAVMGILGSAVKMGYKLGKDKRYKRMGLMGVTGSYNRRPAPWEV